MRQTARKLSCEKFSNINQKYWLRFEELIRKKNLEYTELDEYSRLYQKTVEDLSFAQTNYPDQDITNQLNYLTLQSHLKMHKRKHTGIKTVLGFFTDIFPAGMGKIMPSILFALLIMIVCFFISFLMVQNNKEMAEIFLPDNTYNSAMSDLENRQKFSNFDNIPPEKRTSISIFIWLNNSKVALICYVFGITFGVGTLYILCFNSFMLGALFAVYYSNGFGLDFMSLIMIHGSIELFAIAISAGCGFSIAASFLSPGRKRRIDSVKKSVYDSLFVLIGLVVMLLVAGLIEGLVTPTKPGIEVRLIIAAANMLLITFYLLYGYLKHRKTASIK